MAIYGPYSNVISCEVFFRKRKSRKTLQTCSTAEDAQCICPNGSMETFIVGCTVDEFAAQILGGMSTGGYQLLLIVLSKLGGQTIRNALCQR